MKRILWAFTALALALAVTFGVVVHDLNQLKVEKVRFISEKLNGRLITFLQISDFHNGRGPGADQILAAVAEVRPHVILLTGDLVNTKDDSMEPLETLLTGLAATDIPRFAVWGNHEHWSGRIPEFTTLLQSHGVTLLDDASVVLNVRNQRFNLVGTDDYSTGNGDLDAAMRGVDTSLFTLVMSHSPEVRGSLPGRSIDLAVVGHTHGGQVSLPLVGCLRVPNQGWLPTYCRGLHDVGDSHLYIDSGLGWSVRKVRFGVQAQVSAITVVMD